MRKRQILLFLLVAAILAALIFFQVQHWRKFDWGEFAKQTTSVRWRLVLVAVAFIYLADSLRAVRWAIFLKPARKVSAGRLVAPQFIGFTGLALLGRPGELIRPYIIARKEKFSFSSQMAVWTVERIFDMAAVAMLIGLNILLSPSVTTLEHNEQLPKYGLALIAPVLLGIAAAVFVRRNAAAIAVWVEKTFGARFPHLTRKAANKILFFREGLNTIHDVPSFVSLSVISLLIWLLVALAYLLVIHSYPLPELNTLNYSDAALLMAFSIAGGVLQLPVVGGGSQLATISALTYFFTVPQESAVSCGMLLWLVTFVSVVPLGLALAHREHVSLRELSQGSRGPEPAGEMQSADEVGRTAS